MSSLELLMEKERKKLPAAGTPARIAFDKMKESAPAVSLGLKPKLSELSSMLERMGFAQKLSAMKKPEGHSDLFIRETNPPQVVGFIFNDEAYLDAKLLGISYEKVTQVFRIQAFLLVQGNIMFHVTPDTISVEVYKKDKDTPLASCYAN